MRDKSSSRSLLGAALGAAALVGAAWILDARARQRQTRRIHRTLVELLLNSLTAGDPATARHSRRVADLGFVLARRLRMGRRERATLRVAALLHDMGKIDDRFFDIVHSHGPLTPEQRAEIKNHPHESAHILGPLEAIHPGIRAIVEYHHECWDGSGYPRGLSGESIPLGARVVALADVFDALTQPRTYRDATPVEEVLERIRQGSGTQFDPGLVALLEDPWVRAEWSRVARQGQGEEACIQAEDCQEEVTGMSATAR